MRRHIIFWKPVKGKDIQSVQYNNSELPQVLSKIYKGTLLSKILDMTKQTPISFQEATQLIMIKFIFAFQNNKIGQEAGDCNWYLSNFIEYVSSQGYHIELTGDEFEFFIAGKSLGHL